MARIGVIPEADAKEIRAKAKFDIFKVHENEKRTNHDVIAFSRKSPRMSAPRAGSSHRGLTSSDLLDTTLALQLRDSADLLLAISRKLREAIAVRAREHKMTPMDGPARTAFTPSRSLTGSSCAHVRRIRPGGNPPARGPRADRPSETFRRGRHARASRPAPWRNTSARSFGLAAAVLSTQVSSATCTRILNTLALTASSIDRWATEVPATCSGPRCSRWRNFRQGPKGLERPMPHKRNPITSEKLALRASFAATPSGAGKTWRFGTERDISHSSVERIIFSRQLRVALLHAHAAGRPRRETDRLSENMAANLEKIEGPHLFAKRCCSRWRTRASRVRSPTRPPGRVDGLLARSPSAPRCI